MSNCRKCEFKCKQHTELSDEYIKWLKSWWEKRVNEIIKWLSRKIISNLELNNSIKNTCVAMITWSDWRFENIPCGSWLDVTIFSKTEREREYFPRLLRDVLWIWLEKFNEKTLESKLFGSKKVVCDLVSFDDVDNLLFYEWNKNLFFPTRIYDSILVYGNEIIYKAIKNYILELIKATPKNTMESWRSRVRTHKKISFSGEWKRKNQDQKHFNINEWKVFYEKSFEIETWVKIWPMRYVQYKTALLITNAIRKEKISIQEAENLPKFMWDRIEFLRNITSGLENENDIKDLINSYYYFVKLHHFLQKEYKKSPKNTLEYEIEWDQKTIFNEYLICLNKIMSGIQLDN